MFIGTLVLIGLLSNPKIRKIIIGLLKYFTPEKSLLSIESTNIKAEKITIVVIIDILLKIRLAQGYFFTVYSLLKFIFMANLISTI